MVLCYGFELEIGLKRSTSFLKSVSTCATCIREFATHFISLHSNCKFDADCIGMLLKPRSAVATSVAKTIIFIGWLRRLSTCTSCLLCLVIFSVLCVKRIRCQVIWFFMKICVAGFTRTCCLPSVLLAFLVILIWGLKTSIANMPPGLVPFA